LLSFSVEDSFSKRLIAYKQLLSSASRILYGKIFDLCSTEKDRCRAKNFSLKGKRALNNKHKPQKFPISTFSAFNAFKPYQVFVFNFESEK